MPALASSVAVSFLFAVSAAAAPIAYNDQIQPILAENCFACHGPDSSTRKGKLRLDRFEFATAKRGDGDLEPAIVPGNPKASPLVERINSRDDEERMPPRDSHKTLTPAEIALLTRWVAEGAVYQEHWSLIAPLRPPVPAVGAVPKEGGTARRGDREKNPFGSPPLSGSPSPHLAPNPIDGFVAQKLAENSLSLAREEAPARLLRRVTFDLTGLPPTPEELAAFVRDPSPAAYDRAVDRLLASEASAEHFARQWLDAVRYADTHGIHIDAYRSIWPYRDWVVGAFRSNLPFDRFTIEQMAGDLLPDATLEQKIASGYNRCLPTTSEGGAIAEEYEAIYAKDRVDTMSTVWLGLTTGCAACHDHKFDPISQRDFYSLTAFFRNNTMPAMDGNVADPRPNVFVPAAADRARWNAVQVEITGARAALKQRAGEADTDFAPWLATAKVLTPPPKEFDMPLSVALVGPASVGATETDAPVAGPYGPATRLDDRDLIVGAPVPLRREESVSFGLLVRITGTPSGPLLSSIGDGERAAGWELFLEQGKIGLRLAGGRPGFAPRGVSSAPLAPDQWHHVMFSFDSGAWSNRLIDVFVDGKTATNAGNINDVPADLESTAPLRLGSRPGVALSGGDVWVQDLRHYERGFTLAQAKPLADVLAAHAGLAVTAEQRTAEQTKALRDHFVAAIDGPARQRLAQLDRLLAEDAALRRRGGISLVMEEKKDAEPFAHVLNRGEYSQRGDKVPAATPGALPALPAGAPRNRLGLAQWLVAPEHPLTARVTVNRAWQHLFGTGLVESAGDFGVTGARPSHPALLDWLAVEFRESGWDYRRLVRLMVTSATYRQSAAVAPALLERDPENRLLARGPRHRLDAEQLRDQALAVSGLLVSKLGGRPVRPYQPDGIWEDVSMKESTARFYRTSSGEDLFRRSLYTVWKRTAPPPAMEILNAPSREVSCVRRDRTNTPLQALVTLNETLFIEASRQLATRALREAAAGTFEARLDAISLRLLGRTLARPERTVVRKTFDMAQATYRREPDTARKLLAVGASPVDAKIPAAELAAWTLVASQVMNLDEALTK